jgi:hypothetical protein
MPAKAGIQNYLETLDSRLRGNDAEGRFKTFYETINLPKFHYSIPPKADLRHSKRLTKRMAAKSTVILSEA